MGELIPLVRRRPRTRTIQAGHPTRMRLFFDLACPLSYLGVVQAERNLGRCGWIPLPGLGAEPAHADVHAQAERLASRLRLPLVWPDHWPAPALSAARAALYAEEHHAGGPFAVAAARLAFAGGFDLEDPEVLAEAAAAAGLDPVEALGAADDLARDERLLFTAAALREEGVARLPALRAGRRWLEGEAAVTALTSGRLRC